MKFVQKEDVVPAAADRWVFRLAPGVALVPYLVAMSVIPLSPTLVGADVDAGALFVVALAGIGILGTLMAGWSSANKYSLLGAMRSAAQLLSYELPIVLSVASVALAAGTLSLSGIVREWSWWWLIWQLPGAVVFLVAALAELQRPPFDMPVADSEIVFGPYTEYTGLRFAFFLLSEYAGIVLMSLLFAVLFLGGWRGPWTTRSAGSGPCSRASPSRWSSCGCGSPGPGSARTSCSGSPGCGWCRSRSSRSPSPASAWW